MEGLIMTGQLILGLSILVGVHEFGHLLAAKAFGMRVEKYSIGFPPKIWGFQYGETEYSLGAIPLGGFVKISGMIDESLDTKSLDKEPEEWEFRSKPAWQRLIVMVGGIVVNIITGISIFILLVYNNGEYYLAKDEFNKHGILAQDLGQEIGLKTGDKVLKINGKDFDRFSDLISPDVLLSDNGYYSIDRNESKLNIDIPVGFLDRFADNRTNFISFRNPFKVKQVLVNSGADKGGLLKGDEFVSINDVSIKYFDELQFQLKENASKEINVKVKDELGKERTLQLRVDEDGKLGFIIESTLRLTHNEYGFVESIIRGTNQAFEVIWVNAKAFGKIFKGEVSASKSLSGPIGIAQIFGGTWNWDNFWRITGLLSMVLAFVNFLPIPVLDGGHVVFLIYEIVSGRKPSDKFLENSQKVGMVLVLGLMGFAIFNDIFKIFF